MTLKVFVHYDQNDGNIQTMTFEDERFFEQRKDAGEHVLEVSEQFDINSYKVDLSTMTIVSKQ